MDINEIRLKNTSQLIKDKFGGNKAAMARAMGVSANNLSRYFGGGVHSRKISDDAARKVEESTGLPRGWMDVVHGPDESLLEHINALSPSDQRLVETFVLSLKASRSFEGTQ